jgi:predicted phage terminase large subunit-like protein
MYPDGKIIQSWDTASTTNEMSDYSVCTTWQVKNDNFYLIDVFREKLEYPDLIRAIARQAGRYDARSVLIEDSAAGTALIQQLRRQRNRPSIVKARPDKDKVTRLHNASVAIEAGRVFLPEKEVSWMDEFKKEFLAFPGGVHDDQVDSVSQFLNWYDNRPRMWEKPLRGL